MSKVIWQRAVHTTRSMTSRHATGKYLFTDMLSGGGRHECFNQSVNFGWRKSANRPLTLQLKTVSTALLLRMFKIQFTHSLTDARKPDSFVASARQVTARLSSFVSHARCLLSRPATVRRNLDKSLSNKTLETFIAHLLPLPLSQRQVHVYVKPWSHVQL